MWGSEVVQGDVSAGECSSCGARHFPARDRCPHCWAEMVTELPLVSVGTVEGYTVVRRAPVGFEAPYVLAIAAFREGVRVTARLEAEGTAVRDAHADLVDAVVGMSVRVESLRSSAIGVRLVTLADVRR